LKTECYAASNPINTDEKYRGGFIINVDDDPSGEVFSQSIEMNKITGEGPGFELLR